MDQTTSTAALLKTPSLLNGLLSQIGDGSAQDSIFSNLLSESGDTISTLVVPQPIPPSSPTTEVATPTASFSTDGPDTSSSGFNQTLSDLSSTLHKVLELIQQRKSETSSSSNHTAILSSKSATTSPSLSTTQNSSSVDQTTDNQSQSGWHNLIDTKQSSTSLASIDKPSNISVSTSPTQTADALSATTDPQTLEQIIVELLAVTQALVKNLQQPLAEQGKESSGQTTEQAALQISDTSSSTVGASTSSLLAALTSIMGKFMPATSLNASGTTTKDTIAATMSLASLSTASLTQLLTVLQKTLQKLLPVLSDAPSASSEAAGILPSLSESSITTPAQQALIPTNAQSLLTPTQQQSPLQGTTKKADLIAISSVQSPASLSTPVPDPSIGSTTQVVTATKEQQSKAVDDTEENPILVLQTSLSGQATPPSSAGQAALNSAVLTAALSKNAQTSGEPGGDLSQDNDSASPSFTSAAKTAEPPTPAAGVTQATGTYSFASTLSAIRATNGGTTGLPTPVDQVILQMSRSVKNGNGEMSIQLQPGDLGKITVKLNIASDGKVQGTVTAQNPQTLDMLQKDSRSLERALQDAGLRADPGSLQFNLSGQGNGNQAGQTAHNNGSSANEDGTISATELSGDTTDIVTSGALSETYYVTPTGVNIRV